MKETTVHSLLIVRTLFERALGLCESDDRYLASAGLVILQDALEMAFYALLIERGVDEAKGLESKSFDELIGELRKAGVPVPKSGTLKSMNKQRVLAKHYAQVAEPVTVRNYLSAAEEALDAIVKTATGFSVHEIFLSDLLADGEATEFLKEAEKLIDQEKYLDALIEIRKAIFVEFEVAYSVFGWRDHDGKSEDLFLAGLHRGGLRAPFWKRNKKWIEENVTDPTEYIQIDYDNWRIGAMELGIHRAELENLRRLTPAVFRADSDSKWCVKHDIDFPANNATLANAKQCLDRAIAIVLKKQEHENLSRHGHKGIDIEEPPIFLGHKVYRIASIESEVVHLISKEFRYRIWQIVSGFDPDKNFCEIWGESDKKNEKTHAMETVHGFLQVQPEEAG